MHVSKNSLSIHLLVLANLYRVTNLYLALYSVLGGGVSNGPRGAHGENRHVDKHDDPVC